MTSRYVVLGLARPRVTWFADVARWSTGAALPVEFVKCVSAQEIRTRVDSGRRFSAALVDAGISSLDRDLLGALRDAGIAVIVVEDAHVSSDWVALGAAAVLPARPTRPDVLDALATHATMVDGIDLDPLEASDQPFDLGHRGSLVAVTGPPGVGVSTTAIALAQGLASAKDLARRTVLADCSLVAEQAMLHDAKDVVPGLPELIDAHRGRRPEPKAIADLTWHVEERGYDLLLGLRRATDWPTLRARSVTASVEGLRRTWDAVVADVDATVEGEAETGSMDVEDRHLLARTVLLDADLVVLVSRPGMKWVHGTVRVMKDLADLGVDPRVMQTVVLGVGKRPKVRAEVTRALAEVAPRSVRGVLAGPVFLPEKDPDLALRDGVALPAAIVEPVASAVSGRLAQPAAPSTPLPAEPRPEAVDPRPITPGELGFFASSEPGRPEDGLGGDDLGGDGIDGDGMGGEDAA